MRQLRLPSMPAPRDASPLREPIWLEWLALTGLLLFAGWLLGVRGVWDLLLRSDPTGITLVIIAVFGAASLWSGARARELTAQQQALDVALRQDRTAWAGSSGWVPRYWNSVLNADPREQAALDILLERAHGPHGTAWWVNGIQLKLGLLGKVIGFSMLAIQIGHIQNFDPSQSQELLRDLTSGLGVALLTTMVGLVGNILLGLQLTRLDRFADHLVLQAREHALHLAQPAPVVA